MVREISIDEINEVIDFVFKWFALEKKRPKVKVRKCGKRFWNILYEVKKAIEALLEECGEQCEDPLDKTEWNRTIGCVTPTQYYLQHLELERNGYITLPYSYRRFVKSMKNFDYVMLLNKSELSNPGEYWHTSIHESTSRK